MATITNIEVRGAKLAYVSCRIDGVACDVDLDGVVREAASLKRVDLADVDRGCLVVPLNEARRRQLHFGPVLYTNPQD